MNEREAARDLLAELRAASESSDLNQPHVFIERDPETNGVQVHGPYPDAYAALMAADLRRMYHNKVTGPPELQYEIAMFFQEGE